MKGVLMNVRYAGRGHFSIAVAAMRVGCSVLWLLPL